MEGLLSTGPTLCFSLRLSGSEFDLEHPVFWRNQLCSSHLIELQKLDMVGFVDNRPLADKQKTYIYSDILNVTYNMFYVTCDM